MKNLTLQVESILASYIFLRTNSFIYLSFQIYWHIVGSGAALLIKHIDIFVKMSLYLKSLLHMHILIIFICAFLFFPSYFRWMFVNFIRLSIVACVDSLFYIPVFYLVNFCLCFYYFLPLLLRMLFYCYFSDFLHWMTG